MKQTLFLLAALHFTYVGLSQTKNFIDQPYLEVSGTADTLIVPDQIFIRIVLSEKDTKDRMSIEDLELKMYSSLESLGIDVEANLTTVDFISNFKNYLLKDKSIFKTKVYTLKLGDAVMASKVFITLEHIGIANCSIDRVSHSEMRFIRNRMRTNAIRDAKERASSLVEPLSQSVGQAIHIIENENVANQGLDGRVTTVRIRGYSSISGNLDELPKIDFEKIKVESAVNVKFTLK